MSLLIILSFSHMLVSLLSSFSLSPSFSFSVCVHLPVYQCLCRFPSICLSVFCSVYPPTSVYLSLVFSTPFSTSCSFSTSPFCVVLPLLFSSSAIVRRWPHVSNNSQRPPLHTTSRSFNTITTNHHHYKGAFHLAAPSSLSPYLSVCLLTLLPCFLPCLCSCLILGLPACLYLLRFGWILRSCVCGEGWGFLLAASVNVC